MAMILQARVWGERKEVCPERERTKFLDVLALATEHPAQLKEGVVEGVLPAPAAILEVLAEGGLDPHVLPHRPRVALGDSDCDGDEQTPQLFKYMSLISFIE